MSEVSTDETFFNGVVADIAEINPKTEISLAEEERVSFLPMQTQSSTVPRMPMNHGCFYVRAVLLWCKGVFHGMLQKLRSMSRVLSEVWKGYV